MIEKFICLFNILKTMELGNLNRFQRRIYLNEMKNRQLRISSKFNDYVQFTAKDFLVDKYFLKGQGLEWDVDKNGNFDKNVCSLVLSYVIDLSTSENGSMYLNTFEN